MKKWANQHYNDPYDPYGHNCKSFVGRATTPFWSARRMLFHMRKQWVSKLLFILLALILLAMILYGGLLYF